jgi:hypothetical protein
MKRWTDPPRRSDVRDALLPRPDREVADDDPALGEPALVGRHRPARELGEAARPGEPWPLPNALGVVPLVPLVNRPRLRGEGRSEIADIIPIQDAINKLAIDELVTSDTSSFPRSGRPASRSRSTPRPASRSSRTAPRSIGSWTVERNAKFGQFEAAELEGYIEAIEQKVQAIASISRTPYHYFLQHGGQPPSGRVAQVERDRLVRKARRKQRHFGEGWEEVIRLAFRALGRPARRRPRFRDRVGEPREPDRGRAHRRAHQEAGGLKVPLKQLWEDAATPRPSGSARGSSRPSRRSLEGWPRPSRSRRPRRRSARVRCRSTSKLRHRPRRPS